MSTKILLSFLMLITASWATDGSLLYLTKFDSYNRRSSIPSLTSKVKFKNEYCEYQDEIPYVKKVNWSHPLIKKAGKILTGGWYSTFSYGDWRKPYALEPDRKGTDKELAIAKARNFLRVLCGEFRDYPKMLEAKLKIVANHQNYAGGSQMSLKDEELEENLFDKITYPAYVKLKSIMRKVYNMRLANLNDIDEDYDDIEPDGYDYTQGRNNYDSKREEYSVPPTSQCEMKYLFKNFLQKKTKRFYPKTYEKNLAKWGKKKNPKTGNLNCTKQDHEYYFNFRGHKNFKPLWLESNAFIWNSRRARTAQINRKDNEYYKRPFAHRYARSRLAWSTYLNHPDKHEKKFAEAANYGGGPILYITDTDADKNGLADYKIFKKRGCGDLGVGSEDDCNKVEPETAAKTKNTTGATANWRPADFWLEDFNFFNNFPTFEERMARLNTAFDRHTNWGPTSFWAENASKEEAKPKQVKTIPAYSPIVACSYEISASNTFATEDYPSTHQYEIQKTKWMYIIRFKKSNYYNEENLLWDEPINFDKFYFNETSLSNDYYEERALDKFGWIPPEDIYANVYFVHGASEKKPKLYDITAP